MKVIKIIIFLIFYFFLTISTHLSAQSIKSVEYLVNTIGSTELQLRVYLNTEMDERVDPNFKRVPGFNENFSINNVENDVIIGTGKIANPGGLLGKNFLKFVLQNIDRKLLDQLIEGKVGYYIFTKKNLMIQLVDSSLNKTRKLLISPKDLKDATVNKLKLSEEYSDMLVKSKGGASFLFKNKIDIGQEIDGEDSTKTNYVISFSYHAPIPFWKSLIWTFNGRLSTQKDDPFNSFAFYPINLKQFIWDETIPFEYGGQLGIEGSQGFSFQRVNLIGYTQALIPNFLDLSYGENRLRLKPVLKFGTKGMIEYKKRKSVDKKNDWQIFSEFYYYIPILKIYSLLVEGTYFYNLTGNKSDLNYNFDITLGANVPGTGFKIMAKYSTGENDINFKNDTKLIIGLLIDIFEKNSLIF